MTGLVEYTLPPGVRAFSTTRAFFAGEAVHPSRERCAQLLSQALGLPAVIAHQQHTDEVRCVEEPLLPNQLEGVDALMTNRRSLCLCVTTADCIPILLYDPQHQAIAAVHAGWRGTVLRIVQKAIAAMQAAYGTQPQSLHAVIGPGISLGNYEVGDEVHEAFAEAGFPMAAISRKQERWHIDLPACNRLQLLESGVPSSNIICTGICTFSNQDYYSYRREGPHTGRILTGITLNPSLTL